MDAGERMFYEDRLGKEGVTEADTGGTYEEGFFANGRNVLVCLTLHN